MTVRAPASPAQNKELDPVRKGLIRVLKRYSGDQQELVSRAIQTIKDSKNDLQGKEGRQALKAINNANPYLTGDEKHSILTIYNNLTRSRSPGTKTATRAMSACGQTAEAAG